MTPTSKEEIARQAKHLRSDVRTLRMRMPDPVFDSDHYLRDLARFNEGLLEVLEKQAKVIEDLAESS